MSPARGRAVCQLPTVVFDFAGVVFDWQPLALLQRVLPQYAVDLASARHWALQIFQDYGGDWAEFDRGTLAPSDLVQRIAQRTGLALPAVQAVVGAVPQSFQPLPGTVALIERLHALGQPVYFLSNMPAPYAAHLVREHAFLRLFTDGVFSAQVGMVKPERAIFDAAARRFGVSPAGLLFFDDVPANVLAAQEAGWQARWFEHADGAAADLHGLGLLD